MLRRTEWLMVLCLAAAPAVAHAVEARDDPSVYQHPAQRIEISPGRALNLYCEGTGDPTVVFESGLGDGTLAWRKVQGKVAGWTRACSYDRANYYFSDPIHRIVTAQALSDDLLSLIDHARLGDRVVLVGHSRGGLNVRLFAYQHPERVAGLVLVDPTITEKLTPRDTTQYVHKYENYLARIWQKKRCMEAATDGRLQEGAPDPLNCLDDMPTDSDPAERALAQSTRDMQTQPAYQASLFSERGNLFYPVDADGDTTDGLSIRQSDHGLGNIPLIVISADWFKAASFKGRPSSEAMAFLQWNTRQMRALAKESTQGSMVSVPSGHYVQDERPDAVIDAISQVIKEIHAIN